MERSKAGTKIKRSPDGLVHVMKNNKQNIVVFYKIWKKCNGIQLTKNKMDLNNRKMTNHPPSPATRTNQRVQTHRWLTRKQSILRVHNASSSRNQLQEYKQQLGQLAKE